MRLNISLTQLRYFLAVADCLSYTEASRRLFVSQPSLSKMVALLETEMGLLLFKRDRRHVSLTPAGAVFAESVRQLFVQLEHSVELAKQVAMGSGQQIRLAIPLPFVLDPLQAVFRNFMGAYPGIHLQIERYNLRDAREALLSGAVDLLLTFSYEEQSLSECECWEFARRKRCWIISQQHPLASKPFLDPVDLSSLSLIIVSEETSPGGYALALRVCERAGFRPHSIIQTTNLETVMNYVELGQGIAIVGQPLADRNIDRFKAYDLPGDMADVGLIFCWKKDAEDPNLGLFIEFIKSSRNDAVIPHESSGAFPFK